MSRVLSISALLLALAAPAWGQSLPMFFDMAAVSEPFDGRFYRIPEIMFHFNLERSALRPGNDSEPVDLGESGAAWGQVYAQGYNANGQAGLTLTVPLGNGCLLHFQGGLLVAVTGGFFGSCGQ